MTETKQFIEDAIEGGWRKGYYLDEYVMEHASFRTIGDEDRDSESIGTILLDPLAWQAVGKTRGWYTVKPPKGHREDNASTYMFAFLEWIWEGKTIEEALGEVHG